MTTGYKLELQTQKTTNLLGNTEKDINKEKTEEMFQNLR